MERVTANMTNFDMQYHLRRQEDQLNKLQNQMSSQSRIQELRDDPIAAAHSTRYKSKITHLERYSTNISRIQGNYRVAEGHLTQANDVLQRIRELAVQGANGTYSKQELTYMGEEVNELLNELVQIANGKNAEGKSLFAGTKVNSDAFRVLHGHAPGTNKEVITDVQYTGNIQRNKVEISEGESIEQNYLGNDVFWAEQNAVYSSVNATNYQVPEDTEIHIDGHSVSLKAGDNIHAIIEKINNSPAAVKAELDPVQQGLVIRSTDPHQLWLQDSEDTTVLQDLGILSGGGMAPPHNFADSAEVYGGSLFDMAINLRDNLYEGNTEQIGSSSLRGIDAAHDKLLSGIADIGAKDRRLDQTASRISEEIPQVTELDSKETDIDLTKAITDLKMMEQTHQSALATAGRILTKTLLDFLR